MDPLANLSVTFLSAPLDVLQAVVPSAEALKPIPSHLTIDVNVTLCKSLYSTKAQTPLINIQMADFTKTYSA